MIEREVEGETTPRANQTQVTRFFRFGTFGANVLVGSQRTSPAWRAHLIREELTQSFGLMNDSPRYSDSIFQVDYAETTDFSALDRTVIEMHHQPAVQPGMNRAEARRALERLSSS